MRPYILLLPRRWTLSHLIRFPFEFGIALVCYFIFLYYINYFCLSLVSELSAYIRHSLSNYMPTICVYFTVYLNLLLSLDGPLKVHRRPLENCILVSYYVSYRSIWFLGYFLNCRHLENYNSLLQNTFSSDQLTLVVFFFRSEVDR